jgi:hypothetical protein
MSVATFRFYGSLNDFLAPRRRQVSFQCRFGGRVSIKDAIEALGVPHPEIDLVTAGAIPVDFSYRLQPDDRIAVYPAFRALDVRAASLVRPPDLDELRFVLDGHLGRLTAYLRLAGLDCLCSTRWDDAELAAISNRERRVVLTRDTVLLKRTIVKYGCWVRATDPRRQLAEVFLRFDLGTRARPFSRCLRCNALLETVAKAAIVDRLPPRTREHYEEFHRCPDCQRIYWAGSHVRAMRDLLGTVHSRQ